jgi:hypothetical protein
LKRTAFGRNPTFYLSLDGLERESEYFPTKDWVYFIHAPGVGIKIGISRNPAKRMANIQTNHPVDLVLLGQIRGSTTLERYLHHRFRGKRMPRGEWFSEEILPLVMLIIERPGILEAA